MFEHLARHSKILVTGPHRSGTTIAATMIGHDTGHGLVREELCRFSRRGVEHWLDAPAKVVIQAPFLSHLCHQYPQALVVFMHRPVEEIERSQARMVNEDGSTVFWPGFEIRTRQTYWTDDYSRPVAEIKYENWREQKERLPHTLDLDYHTLRNHPLWLDDREGFHVRQTSALDERAEIPAR